MMQNPMDQTASISSPRNNEETEMEQVSSDLQSLQRLYGLLYRGSAGKSLDDTSKALLMKMLDDATQQALLRQAKMLSGSVMSPALESKVSIRSDRQTCDAEPRLGVKPPASPILSLSLSRQASVRSRRLNPQNSVSSRVHGHRDAEGATLLARLASNRSSRTAAMSPRPKPSPEQHRLARLDSQRSSMVGMPRYDTESGSTRHADRRRDGTVAGSSRYADHLDGPRYRSSHGDMPSSPEIMSGRRLVSGEPSLGLAGLDGRATARHVGEEGGSSPRRFGKLDSGLSGTMASRRFGRLGSGLSVATPRYPASSSSNTMAATIRSRIRPQRELTGRQLRRAVEGEEESIAPRRGRKDDAVSTAGMSSSRHGRPLSRIDSGSMYSGGGTSGSASFVPSTTSLTASPASSASASSYSPPVSRKGSKRPTHVSKPSGSSRSRGHGEREEKHEGRLRKLKNKIAMVFHHRHDHHHHHHLESGQEGRSRRDDVGGVLGHEKGKDNKKSTSRAGASSPEKRRGGGNKPVSPRHLPSTRRKATARGKKVRTGSRLQAKKLH
ncbi:hypothetical protein ACP70R_010250 [Stipagrostis hirtigluma subsp. patula]